MVAASKITTPGIPRATSDVARPRVLVVDDEPGLAAAHARHLRDVASGVVVATDGGEALAKLEREAFDVVVSDIRMPNMSGTELLREVRARDLDLPVIFLTGDPSLETATLAVELGAFRYLSKPIAAETLRAVVVEAARVRALARTRSGVLARAELERALRSAIARLRMVYQPIVSVATQRTVAYEALMRSNEPALPNPPALLDAAEKLGALHVLGRHVRNLVSADLDGCETPPRVFVNLHSSDLADPHLFDRTSPLARHAPRIVLEITERASLEGISDLDTRRNQLRDMGYRLAVDDLGAGYAGLSYFARIRPEIVKIDMSLVRAVDSDTVKQHIVASLVGLAASLGMECVAEGVETAQERDVVARLGCTLLQGYLFARPGPPFPDSRWE